MRIEMQEVEHEFRARPAAGPSGRRTAAYAAIGVTAVSTLAARAAGLGLDWVSIDTMA